MKKRRWSAVDRVEGVADRLMTGLDDSAISNRSEIDSDQDSLVLMWQENCGKAECKAFVRFD